MNQINIDRLRILVLFISIIIVFVLFISVYTELFGSFNVSWRNITRLIKFVVTDDKSETAAAAAANVSASSSTVYKDQFSTLLPEFTL